MTCPCFYFVCNSTPTNKVFTRNPLFPFPNLGGNGLPKVTSQGVVLSTIIVGNKNQTVAPVFYIDGYSENGYTEEAAAQSIYENYQKNIGETTRMNDNELIHKLSRFSNVKNNICYKIVNTQANKKLFSNAPHFPITDDLSVMYYLQIERGAPATITNQMLDIWE